MAALAGSALRYSARHEAAASDSFADHVIAGLGDQQKWLSAKYFYDAAGSDLFEEITRLPEYYPTRTELKILEANAPAMSAYIPLAAALVEFGTGSRFGISRSCRSWPISPATSTCRRRSARARVLGFFPARPSGISSRRTRRNSCARPGGFSAPAQP